MPVPPSPYPDIVGNYYGGLDAGTDRAVKMEELKQKLQTQNALVRLNNPQTAQGFQPTTYPEVQAMQLQAKQMSDIYVPALQEAVKNENYEMRDAIADRLEKSGNPILQQLGAVARTAKKLDKDDYGYDITFTSPEQRSAAYVSDPFLQAAFPNAEAIQLNTPYRYKFKGMPGAPGSRTTNFELVSRTLGKPVVGTTTIKSVEQIAELEQKYADNPDVLARLKQARLLLPESPTGVDVSLPEAGGVKASKTQEKYRVDSVSTEAGLRSSVADAPPGVAQKILTEAMPAIKKGYTVVLERDSKGALTGLIHSEKRPSTGGGGGASASGSGGEFPVLKYNDPRRYYGSLFKKSGGETEFATMVSRFLSASVGGRNAFQAIGLSAGKQNDAKREEFLARVSDFMEQRGITQADITTAAGATSAIKQMAKQQSMMEVNASVAEKGFEMVSNLRKEGKISTNAIPMLNHAENILRTWSGDAMPGAAQGILTETLVDYAKVVSGQTSTAGVTMYAAKLAKELLELKDNPAQFQKKIDQYRSLMKTRLSSGRSAIKGLGAFSDVGNKEQPPSLDDYIKRMVQKFPQYKNKSRSEWEAAYNKKFGGGAQ